MDLGNRVDALTDIVKELADGFQELTERPPASRAPWWPDLDEPDRLDAWRSLVDWLRDSLVIHQPQFSTTLRPCWSMHPDVVDELSALHATWRAAYKNPQASPAAASEWLDRWVPGARRRIEAALGECKRKRDHESPSTGLPGASSMPTWRSER